MAVFLIAEPLLFRKKLSFVFAMGKDVDSRSGGRTGFDVFGLRKKVQKPSRMVDGHGGGEIHGGVNISYVLGRQETVRFRIQYLDYAQKFHFPFCQWQWHLLYCASSLPEWNISGGRSSYTLFRLASRHGASGRDAARENIFLLSSTHSITCQFFLMELRKLRYSMLLSGRTMPRSSMS